MKVTKKLGLVLIGILFLTLIAYIFSNKSSGEQKRQALAQEQALANQKANELSLPEPNRTPDVNVLPSIPEMPSACDISASNIPIANFPDLDRQPLADQTLSLLPANEMLENNYKEWEGGKGSEKELYANTQPLFPMGGSADLVPLDVNAAKRRINFY